MKKKMVLGIVGLVVIGVAAFLVATSGVPEDASKWKSMRGTEAYYADSDTMTAADVVGELLANLADDQIVKMHINAEYRVGKEWQEEPEKAAAAFSAKKDAIRSELTIMFGSRTKKDTIGANLLMLKEEIIRIINRVVFPERMARVEDVIFKEILVQG